MSEVERHEWRVDRRMTSLKAAGAAVFLAVAVLLGRDVSEVVIGLVAAAALAGFALRDVLAPVRLAADASGLTVVTGYAAQRQLPWAQVERVHVDSRTRLGRRHQFLEVDTGEQLYLFTRAELSADLDDVAAAVAHLRTGR